MNRVRVTVHAEEVNKMGIRGRGIGVAVLDTGISLHPDFGRRIVCFCDFLSGRRSCYDDCSHGTHVSGILGGSGAASDGKYRGIAPECHLIGLKVLDQKGNGNKEEMLAGIDWVIKNHKAYGIRILNISVGTVKESASMDMQLIRAVERAWDEGLVVVVAAGNMGPDPMSITVPGNSRKVITVGASDDCVKTAVNGVKTCYSGRGPTAECICKPDITAPGSLITSCNAIRKGKRGFYTVKSGTSMATPIVSGCIALLLSVEPELSNVQIKMRLHESAVDLGLPRHQQGWGRIDVCRLLRIPALE
ncbi:MAG: S8 family peptidase [Blautia sp.]|nr:S8 family peptidase [Blautia sp.]MDY4515325.1 S8 family peptidase [Lachnospiraceae bacterium]